MNVGRPLYPLVLIVIASLFGCAENRNSDATGLANVEGTWRLVSETKIQENDTTYIPASPDLPMIKIINRTHFAFLRHDLNQGRDSATAFFVAGGGTYTLNGDRYREKLEYCTLREWENNDFEFTLALRGDTLTQSGREKVEGAGIDRIIIEKYVRTTGR